MTQAATEKRRAAKAQYMREQRAAFPEKYKAKSREFFDKNRERLKAERNAKYKENKAEVQARRHGTTVEKLNAMLALQQDRCAICEKHLAAWPSKETHIDHCHGTGKVRGLLCRSCNMKEGWVKRYGAKLFAYLAHPTAERLEQNK
jgi:uncharacterized protein with PIN domain